MVSLVTTALISNADKDFLEISKIIFYRLDREANWIQLWSKEPIAFIKMSIFNFKFELARLILEKMMNDYSEAENGDTGEIWIESQKVKKFNFLISSFLKEIQRTTKPIICWPLMIHTS